MRILIISSSPRTAGNSEVLCERFAKGASEAGHEVEMLLLRQMNIAPAMPVMPVWKRIPAPFRMI